MDRLSWTLAGLVALATVAWLGASHWSVQAPVTLRFSATGGATTVSFLPESDPARPSYSAICGCREPWKGLGLPVEQFAVNVRDHNDDQPWALIVEEPVAPEPANWFGDDEDSLPTGPMTIVVSTSDDEVLLRREVKSVTIETNRPVYVTQPDGAYAALSPADGATTTVDAGRVSYGGVGFVNVTSEVPSRTAVTESTPSGRSDFRATMIDVLGPAIELTLNSSLVEMNDPTYADGSHSAPSVRLVAGLQAIDLPEGAQDITITIEGPYAIRLKPLPLATSDILPQSNEIAAIDPAQRYVVSSNYIGEIPAHTVELLNGVTPEASDWMRMVENAQRGLYPSGQGTPDHTLPPFSDEVAVTMFGPIASLSTNAMVGTIIANGEQTSVAAGDLVNLASTGGLDAGTNSLALLPAAGGLTTESVIQGIGSASVSHEGQNGVDAMWSTIAGTGLTTLRLPRDLAAFVLAAAVVLLIEHGVLRLDRARRRWNPESE